MTHLEIFVFKFQNAAAESLTCLRYTYKSAMGRWFQPGHSFLQTRKGGTELNCVLVDCAIQLCLWQRSRLLHFLRSRVNHRQNSLRHNFRSRYHLLHWSWNFPCDQKPNQYSRKRIGKGKRWVRHNYQHICGNESFAARLGHYLVYCDFSLHWNFPKLFQWNLRSLFRLHEPVPARCQMAGWSLWNFCGPRANFLGCFTSIVMPFFERQQCQISFQFYSFYKHWFCNFQYYFCPDISVYSEQFTIWGNE